MNFHDLLVNSISPDKAIRDETLTKIGEYKLQDPGAFITGLVEQLVNENESEDLRQLAGVQLKNFISRETDQRLQGVWRNLSGDLRTQIKSAILCLLATPSKKVRNSAASCVAAIASMEIPNKEWPELISMMIKNSGLPELEHKLAALQTLGYICEDLKENDIETNERNQIFAAICENLDAEQTNPDVKLIAISALLNSLQFAKSVFENGQQREYIFGVILGCCNYDNHNVKIKAFQCLCDIAKKYYDFLQDFIPKIAQATFDAMNQSEEKIGLQAMEFWCSLCDEEIDRLENYDEHNQPAPGREARFYIKGVADDLTVFILMHLAKDNEFDDEWNISMACGSLLGLVAQIVGNPIVDKVLEYVTKYISSPEWYYRDAAILAFGSIMEGPTANKLSQVIASALPTMIEKMGDAHSKCRGTAAWTLGRICEFHCNIVASHQHIGQLCPALLKALEQDESEVAAHACYCLYHLVCNLPQKTQGSNLLSPHFERMCSTLLNCAYRNDAATETNLAVYGLTTLSSIIERAPKDGQTTIKFLLKNYIDNLKQTIQINNETNEQKQILLCGCIQVSCIKLGDSLNEATASELMFLFADLMTAKGGVTPEILAAVGALAGAIGDKFEPHLENFFKYLKYALGNVAEPTCVKSAILCLADIIRALEGKFSAYAEESIQALVELTKNESVDESTKSHIILALGDIGLYCKEQFPNHLVPVMELLNSAAQHSLTVAPEDDYEQIEYLDILRENLVEAYTGILHGLNEIQMSKNYGPYIPDLIKYMLIISDEAKYQPTLDLLKSAVGFLGDLAYIYGGDLKTQFTTPEFQAQAENMISKLQKCNRQDCKGIATWTTEQITIVVKSE